MNTNTAVPDTLDDWRAYLTRRTVPMPERLDRATLQRLPEADKAAYDLRRKTYLGSEHVLGTLDWQDIGETLAVLRDQNLGDRPIARQGLLVSGRQRTGKSTAILNHLKRLDRQIRLESDWAPDDISVAPTMALVAPNEATARKLWERFALYLGLRTKDRENADQIAERVLKVLETLQTQVVFIDEVQNLRTTSEAGTSAGSALKGFTERLPITWVWAGVDVVRANGEQRLFTGKMGQQMRGRVLTHEMNGYHTGTQDDREDWQALIEAAEGLLPLAAHEPGSLAANDWSWLYDHTGGSVGALWDIIHNAAIRAIRNGSEKITSKDLEDRWLSAADKDFARSCVSTPGKAKRSGPSAGGQRKTA